MKPIRVVLPPFTVGLVHVIQYYDMRQALVFQGRTTLPRKCRKKKDSRLAVLWFVVAGVGFEPATFGL